KKEGKQMRRYSELRGLLAKKNSSMSQLARELGMSYPAVFNRFHGKTFWDTKQIEKIALLYGIEKNEIPKYFFNESVSKIETLRTA
ncbi:DUF739 family protein, partial [Oenococcus oeni]